MERKKYVIVTAGGTGTRMGASVPKQFLELDGKPILRRTLERIREAVPDVHILTVLPQEHVTFWRHYCLQSSFTCPQRLVVGGFTRFHSVKNALEYVPDGALVAVHDGVRPLVSAGLVRSLFEAAAHGAPAVIPVLPATDTLKVLAKGQDGLLHPTGEALDRSRVWAAQTPQVFHSEALKAAYAQGYDTLFTDDASVAERYGISLAFVPGERTNLKITTPEDLALAQAIMKL